MIKAPSFTINKKQNNWQNDERGIANHNLLTTLEWKTRIKHLPQDGHLVWTLVIWVWEFEFGFSNMKQKIWVDERGNGNCWFHFTICCTNIQLTSNNQNKWTTKKTQIGNNKQHFQTSNLHFNSKQWPLWNKFWYVKLTFKSFVPKSCHSKTRKKNDNYMSKAFSNSKP